VSRHEPCSRILTPADPLGLQVASSPSPQGDTILSDAIRVTPIANALGAEISGVDLADVSDAIFEQIHAAFLAHQVLFFRNQPLTVEEHKAFGARFGRLHVHPVHQPMKAQGHPEVVVLESPAGAPKVARRWHSDVTFEQRPPLGSVLRACIVPESGGDTVWTSTCAAYEALSEGMQRRISGLDALHDGVGFARELAKKKGVSADEVQRTATHPVVRTHPETGRKTLFVNPVFTTHIVGMKPNESRSLLDELFAHIGRSEFQCRFHWEPHAVAVWDNRCTQHRVLEDGLTSHRRMERVTIMDDRPVA